MERMSSRNERTTEAAQMPQDMPTSPWTETFQNAQTFAFDAASQANRQSQPSQQGQQGQMTSGARDQKIQAQGHADADAARPTQDALSEIFNGI